MLACVKDAWTMLVVFISIYALVLLGLLQHTSIRTAERHVYIYLRYLLRCNFGAPWGSQSNRWRWYRISRDNTFWFVLILFTGTLVCSNEVGVLIISSFVPKTIYMLKYLIAEKARESPCWRTRKSLCVCVCYQLQSNKWGLLRRIVLSIELLWEPFFLLSRLCRLETYFSVIRRRERRRRERLRNQ